MTAVAAPSTLASSIGGNALRAGVGLGGIELAFPESVSTAIKCFKDKTSVLTDGISGTVGTVASALAPIGLAGLAIYEGTKEKLMLDKAQKMALIYGIPGYLLDFALGGPALVAGLGIYSARKIGGLLHDGVSALPDLPGKAFDGAKNATKWVWGKTLGRLFSKGDKKAD